jgi:hypothetical protein
LSPLRSAAESGPAGSDTGTHEGGSLSMKALAIKDDRAWTATRLGPLIWLAVFAAAVFASDASPLFAGITAAVGCATTLLWPETRPALLAPLVPAALGGFALLPWAIAGVALCWPHRTLLAAAGRSELQRHIMRCRRREEEATVLLAVGPHVARRPLEDMLESLRATDSVEVSTGAHDFELCALLDGVDFAPDVIERRIADAGDLDDVSFGWARFPRDGVTLAVLRERALADARGRASDPERRAVAAQPDSTQETESRFMQAKI